MKKTIIAFVILSILCMSLNISALASENVTISVDNINAQSGGIVDVPIRISGNNGICGATIWVTYDNRLVLTDIKEGSGLPTLTMTKPGDMSSNPFTLVWDGVEADNTNGIIAILSFSVPSFADEYSINISCADGDVVDGELNPIPVVLQSGKIIVGGGGESGRKIIIGSVSAKPEETVEVPITLSGNTGICGATILIEYDKRIVLTDIKEGSGLSTLIMTKPGDITSNPFTLVWDGTEQDTSNGIIATLIFTAPKEEGTYNIGLTYNYGDIVDGELIPVSFVTENGQICVKKEKEALQSITETTVKKLTSTYKFSITSTVELIEEKIIVAAYSKTGALLSIKSTTFDGDTEGNISLPKNPNISYAKVFVWGENGMPLGGAEIISKGFN